MGSPGLGPVEHEPAVAWNQEGHPCPEGTRSSITGQTREGLSHSAVEQPHLQSWGQLWVPQQKKDLKLLASKGGLWRW